MKIAYLNKISKVGTDLLPNNYTLTDDIKGAVAILVRSQQMHDIELDKETLAVARAGAGVNNIPLEKYAANGVVVFNTPGANANGVKELVIAGLLLAARDIVGGINYVKANKDDKDIAKVVEKVKSQFAGTEILGKSIGIIGLGHIGVLVANALIGLGMDVYGYDPYLTVDNARSLSRNVKYVKTLDDIYKLSDYITLHIPSLPATKGMINKEAFNKMKDNVVILNFSRDNLVNEQDLKEALEDKKIYKYITDFPNENVVHLENVIAIPHLGASTNESEDNCAIMAVNQIVDYIQNGNIINSVNYPNLDAGVLTAKSRITINHKNIPNMINNFTDLFKDKTNIVNLYNKSKNDFAYTVLDLDENIEDIVIEKILKIDGVFKARLIK